MNKQKMKIWGREFDLDVLFYSDEEGGSTVEQEKALDLFLKANSLNVSGHDDGTSCKTDNAISLIDSSKTEVEKYCVDNANGNDIDDPIINIFKYVIPKSIFVDEVTKDTRTVALLCNFKFDMEHGLAVIFKNEKLDKIGEQGLVF